MGERKYYEKYYETLQTPLTWPPTEGNKIAVKPFNREGRYNFETIFQGDDETEIIRKLKTMTKYSSMSALMLWTYDCVLLERLSFSAAAPRVFFWGAPLIGGGLAYCSTVYIMGNLQNKSSYWNHVAGGMMAGAVLGSCRRNFFLGLNVGILYSIFGVLFRRIAIHQDHIMPHVPNKVKGFSFGHQFDFTVKQDYPSYWVRKPIGKDDVVNE